MQLNQDRLVATLRIPAQRPVPKEENPVGRHKRHITGFIFVGICSVNVCCLRNTIERNLELGIYRDQLKKVADNDVICLSLNINGLQVERWKIKNDLLRNLLVSSKANIVGLQKVNLNWSKILFRHQWDSRSLG